MQTISIRELIDLVASDITDTESRIQKLFEWRFEREMSIARWALGLTASLTIAVVVASFANDTHISYWVLGVGLAFALASATFGIYTIFRLRRINRQFIATMKLYSQLRLLQDFIKRYREAIL